MWTYEYGSVQDEKAVPCSLMVRSGKDTCPGESTPSRPLLRGHWSRRLLQPTVPCLSPGTQRKPGWELLPPLFLWPGQGGDPVWSTELLGPWKGLRAVLLEFVPPCPMCALRKMARVAMPKLMGPSPLPAPLGRFCGLCGLCLKELWK